MCGVSTTWSISSSGWPGGQLLAVEVVEPGPGQVTAAQGLGQGVEVVEPGAGRVQVHRAGAHGGEAGRAHQAERLGGGRRVHRHDVGLAQQGLERVVGGVGRVRVVRDDRHAQALEAPSHRPPDGTEADETDRAPRDLPGPEPLVGDGSVAEHLAGPHVAVAGHHVAGHGQQQRRR